MSSTRPITRRATIPTTLAERGRGPADTGEPAEPAEPSEPIATAPEPAASEPLKENRALRATANEHASGSVLKWMLTRKPARWPKWVASTPGPAPPEAAEPGQIRWVVVNHSTVLIQVDGFNLLLDPIWSMRCSPLPWAGPRRVRAPGLRFEDLPPIDVVAVSHNHYDHCDLPTLERLAKRHDAVAITGAGNRDLLAGAGFERVVELDWWQQHTLQPVSEGGGAANGHHTVELHFVPTQHFSARGLLDRNRTRWGGFVLETSRGPIYFGADTGYRREIFRSVRERFGEPVLSFLPIGAYEPRWFMGPVHMDPAEAVQAHQDLGSAQSVGIHFGTFQLTDEGIDEPVIELERARLAAGVGELEFVVPEFGIAG